MRQKSASRNNKAAAINKRLDTSTSTNSRRKSIQRPSNGQRPSIVGQSNVSRMAQSLNKLSKPMPNKLNADSIMITIQNDEYVPVNQPSPKLNLEIQRSIKRPLSVEPSYEIQKIDSYSAPGYPSSVGVRYVMPDTVLNTDVRF